MKIWEEIWEIWEEWAPWKKIAASRNVCGMYLPGSPKFVGGEKQSITRVHQIEEGKGSIGSFDEGVVRAMEAGSGQNRWLNKRPDDVRITSG